MSSRSSAPGAAGMVQVHVGGDDVVHRAACEPGGVECGQEHGHAVQRPAVDEGRAPRFHHEVGGAEGRPRPEAGVDELDAVVHGWRRPLLRNSSARSSAATSNAPRNTP